MEGRAKKFPLRIRVVAPAGPASTSDLEAGVAVLRGRGFHVEEALRARGRRGYLSGTDAERLADLVAALEDPAVDVVWFARGGYGTTRILHALTPSGPEVRPKILAGFSDATALFAWAQRRHRLLYAPSVQELARPGVCRLPPLWSALAGKPLPVPGCGPKFKAGPWPVFGGCLTILSVLVGTPWEPALVDRWLFLEDVGERLYRLDRLLTHLRSAGWFDRAAGVLLGGFTGLGEGEEPSHVADRVREVLPPGKPLVTGLPVGHRRAKLPLPFEAPALWDGKALRFTPLDPS
jgi:muramoyltetrapeptide carboxypeptidase